MMGPMPFGRMCFNMMRASDVPHACAASTYSISTTVSTDERTIRVNTGAYEMVSAISRLVMLGPSAATTHIASSVDGRLVSMSMKRMMISSRMPP